MGVRGGVYEGVAEDQVDVVAGVLLEQFVAEPQDLGLIGNIAGMAGDRDAGWRGRPRGGRGHGDGVRVQVARRDRAALRRQLAASSRPMPKPPPVTTASLPVNESIAHDRYLRCHCSSTIHGAWTSTARRAP